MDIRETAMPRQGSLGLGTEPRHVEGMRSKRKRLVERGILAEPSSGLFKVEGRKQGW
ncbi:hypothetical protein [Streptomyces sp. NPDC019208]|uniref:hypothetical protein n=1 Tax=Streptomyces sp. NPDC019208 TaxID=3154683 RepID=UPI0033E82686